MKEFDNLSLEKITDLKSNNCETTGKFIFESEYEGRLEGTREYLFS